MASNLQFVKYADLKLGVLEYAHALKVLYALQNEGPTAKSVLYSMISTNGGTVKDRVVALSNEGLVEEGPMDKPPYRGLYLTERGKEVAEHVTAIEQILKQKH